MSEPKIDIFTPWGDRSWMAPATRIATKAIFSSGHARIECVDVTSEREIGAARARFLDGEWTKWGRDATHAAFLDSDDYFLPESLERDAYWLRRGYDVVFSDERYEVDVERMRWGIVQGYTISSPIAHYRIAQAAKYRTTHEDAWARYVRDVALLARNFKRANYPHIVRTLGPWNQRGPYRGMLARCIHPWSTFPAHRHARAFVETLRDAAVKEGVIE